MMIVSFDSNTTVQVVQQELLTLPEHTPEFLWGSGCSTFRFLCSVMQIIISLFSLLTFVLSVLRFTASNYPFGIFKLFVCMHGG